MFASLLVMLGLAGKRRTDQLTVDLAELGTQVSFARAAGLSRELAGTTVTAGQAHKAVADPAVLLSGADGTLGLAHPSPDVVMLDGTGARTRSEPEGVGVRLPLGLPASPGRPGGAFPAPIFEQPNEKLSDTPSQWLWGHLIKVGDVPTFAVENREHRRLFEPGIRADYSLLEQWRDRPRSR